jgi:predicted sulfurtransferase
MLALGLCVGCTAEASGADSKATSKESGTPNTTPKAHRVETLDAADAARLIAENDDVIILDIRTPGEFQRGHLKGAVNVDYKAEDYAEKLGELDKQKTYLLH